MPLDLSTLTDEERALREKMKVLSQSRVYVEEEGFDDEGEEFTQDRYSDLL